MSAVSIAGWPGMAVSPGKAPGTVVSDAASMILEEALMVPHLKRKLKKRFDLAVGKEASDTRF